MSRSLLQDSCTRSARAALPLIATLICAATAQAHVGVGSTQGAGTGFAHPLGGLDHVLAMVAVGLWAAQQGGRAIWLLPLSFVGLMAVGGAIGIAGVALPGAERGIAMSLLVLGVLVAACARLPLVAGALLVGVFAIFHGHSHGAEMPATAGGLAYAAGFLGATLLLHLVGIGIVLGLQSSRRIGPATVRTLGAAVSIAGLVLLCA